MNPQFLQYVQVAIEALMEAHDSTGSEAAETLALALQDNAGPQRVVESALAAGGFEDHEIREITSTLYFNS